MSKSTSNSSYDMGELRRRLQLAEERLAALSPATEIAGPALSSDPILDALPAHIVLLDVNGIVVSSNRSWRRHAATDGPTRSNIATGDNYLAHCASAPPERAVAATKIAAGICAVLQGTSSEFSFEYSCPIEARPRWYRIVAKPLGIADGAAAVLMHVNTTEGRTDSRIQRLNRLYLVLSRIGESIVRIRDRISLYEATCRISVEDGGMQMALIVEIDPFTRAVKPVASVGASAEFLSSWRATVEDGPDAMGTIGTALRSGRYDVCNDFLNDPRMAPWREGVGGQHFRAGASFPLRVGGTIIGALGLFAGEAGYFQADEIALMVAVADDLSFAVETLQKEQQRQWAEAALRASEASMAMAQRIGHFGSWELDLREPQAIDANPLHWSDEMFRIAGFAPGGVAVSNELFFSLVPADEHPRVRQAMATAIAEHSTYSIVHGLTRANGEQRLIRETAELMLDPITGKPLRMVGTAHDITEHRHAQESLRLQAHALNSIGQSVIATDRTGAIIYANRAASELYGWSAESVLGRSIFDVTVALESREHARGMSELSKSAVWNGELPMQRSDGSQFPAWMSNSPLLDIDGHPQGYVAVSFDISERKRHEDEMTRHAGRLASLVEAQHNLTSTEASVEELIATVPEMAQRLLGADAAVFERLDGDELLCQHASGLATAFIGMRLKVSSSLSGEAIRLNRSLICDDTELDPRVDVAACRKASVRSMLTAVLRTHKGAFGAIKAFSRTPRRFTDADARSLELLAESLGVVIERQRAIEQLRSSERQYRLLFDSNPHPMWAIDIETLGFLTVNEAALHHYGYSRDEWLAMNIRQIRPTSDVSRIDHWHAQGMATGKSFGLWRHQKKSGEVIDVEVSADELMFNGRHARLVLAHDVTERLRAERKLKRSLVELSARNRELQDFAFIASHDLQEPLRKVRAFADRLVHSYADRLDAHGQEYLERMTGAVARMQRLIDALLDYSRVLSNARPLVAVDLNLVLRDVLDDLEERLLESNGSVELCVLPTVSGDNCLLGQVFQNLIANALKFRVPGRAPYVRMSVHDVHEHGADAWQIDVEDNGIGFAEEFREKIFAPFQRLHGRDVYDGTGIGLAIVRRIIERHGGSVTAKPRVGSGAVFQVTLPKHAPAHLLDEQNSG